jgi:hypothetical protein
MIWPHVCFFSINAGPKSLAIETKFKEAISRFLWSVKTIKMLIILENLRERGHLEDLGINIKMDLKKTRLQLPDPNKWSNVLTNR